MLGKMMCRQVPTLPIGGYATALNPKSVTV